MILLRARRWFELWRFLLCVWLVAWGARAEPAPPTAKAAGAAPASTEPDIRLRFDVSLEALFAEEPLLSSLNGGAALRVEFSASPRPDQPGVDRLVVIESTDARYGRLPLEHLAIRVTSLAGRPTSDIRIEASSAAMKSVVLELSTAIELDPIHATLTWPDGPIEGKLVISQLDLDQLTNFYPVLAMQGRLSAQVQISGATDAPRIESQLNLAGATYRAEPVGEVQVNCKLEAGVSDCSLHWGDAKRTLLTAHLNTHLDAALNRGGFFWKDDEPLGFELDAERLTAQDLRPFWTPPEGFGYDVAVQARASGPLSALVGTLQANANVHSGKNESQRLTLVGNVGSATQSLKLTFGQHLLELDLGTVLSLPALRKGTATLANAPLSGTLASELPLGLLQPFTPSWLSDVRGRLSSRIAVAGLLGAPQVQGSLHTVDTSAAVLPLSERLERVQMKAELRDGQLSMTELSGAIGRGQLKGSGWSRLSLDSSPTGELWGGWRWTAGAGLALSRVPLLVDGLSVGVATVAGTLSVDAHAGDTVAKIKLNQADIVLSDEPWTPPKTIATNPGVRVRDWLGREQATGSLLAGDGHLRLELALLAPATLKAPEAQVALSGGFVLERDGRFARTEGGLALRSGGSFELFGTPFKVQSGLVSLLGGDLAAAARAASGRQAAESLHDADAPSAAEPLDVIVDVLAEGKAVDTRVAVELRGPLRRPALILASSPELPEYQIVTLLVTGRVDSVDERDGQVRRAVAKLVDQFHNPSLRRQLFDKLGIDKLGLGFGRSVSEPILTVGRQMNRQLYVESVYHHNAPPDVNSREGRVEYRLNPRWTVNTAFGDAAEGSAGLQWRLSFNGPPRPRLGDTISLFGKKRAPTDSDGDGLPDDRDRCPFQAEDLDGYQDDDGCLDPDDDGDGVPDDRDRAPRAAETKNGYRDDDGVPDTVPARLTWVSGNIRTLGLAKNSVLLSRDAQATLAIAQQLLLDYPEFSLDISGHTDDRGDPVTNQSIADARARAVENRLVQHGIARTRLHAIGVGSAEPLDPTDSDEARAKNRRIEMALRFAEMPGPAAADHVSP